MHTTINPDTGLRANGNSNTFNIPRIVLIYNGSKLRLIDFSNIVNLFTNLQWLAVFFQESFQFRKGIANLPFFTINIERYSSVCYVLDDNVLIAHIAGLVVHCCSYEKSALSI